MYFTGRLPKVRLQNYLIGAACNLRRLFRRIQWLAEQVPIMVNNTAMAVAG